MIVLTRRTIEEEFSTIPSIFSGEETESNWKARHASIIRLRGMVKYHGILLLATFFTAHLTKVINDVIQPMFSSRRTLALDCLDFVAEIGKRLGPRLPLDNAETVISSLIKCCSTLKKSIFTKANEVTISFLQNVCFSTDIVAILCKTIDGKNNRVRQSAAEFLITFLKIHARKFQGNSSDILQKYIKKGLADASPNVRELCRETYWVYYEHWPKEAEKICLEMDSEKIQQLKAAQKKDESFPTASQKDTTTKKSNSKSSSFEIDYTEPIPWIPFFTRGPNNTIQEDKAFLKAYRKAHMSAIASSKNYKLKSQLAITIPKEDIPESHKKKGSLMSPKTGQIEMIEEKEAIYETPKRTKISRKATEELRPEEKMKKRHVSEESKKTPAYEAIHVAPDGTKNSRKATEELRTEEELKKRRVSVESEELPTLNDTSESEEIIKKGHVSVKTYNPTLDNLNQVARSSLGSIQEGTEMMKTGKINPSLLFDLQIVSENTPLRDINNVDADSIFWLYDLARPFLNCLKEVTSLIHNKDTAHIVKYEAISLALSLIHNQKALFLNFKNLIVNGQASYLYSLVRALSKEHVFPITKETINDLLAIYPPDLSEKLLKDAYKTEL